MRVVLPDLVFEVHRYLIDVTSINRPDPSWHVHDPAGHCHQWYVETPRPGSVVGGRVLHPARSYHPEWRYELPTLTWVVTGKGYYEDGEEFEIGEYRCIQCGVGPIHPGRRADDCTQYISGLTYYYINDVTVSKDEFERQFRLASQKANQRRE